MGHTSHKTDDNTLKLLTFMCEDYTSLTTRVATTSIKNSKFPNCVEAIILLIEYIQLMTQALILTPANNNDFSDEETFFKGIVYIAKMFNPGYYVDFEGKSTLPTIILFIIVGFMILRYLLLGYILAVAYWNIPAFNFLQRIWGFIYKIQARILCCLLCTFWMNAIVSSRGIGFSFLGLGETQIVVLSIFMIVIEYVFSFALVSRLCYILPTKSFLSSKSNSIESFTLFQKFVIQILEIIFTANKSTDYASSSNVWVFVIINLLLSIGRDAQYYSTLPLYNIKALKFQSFLLQIATSLNLAAFFQAVVKSAGDDEPDTEFIVVLWVILSILSVTVASSLVESFTLDVASSKLKYTSPELLVHKVIILKRLRKTWHGLNENSDRTEWPYFLNRSVNVHTKTILNISSDFPSEIPLDINSKESARKMFCHYLENISAKYPKDKFIKLYLAYFYAKKLRQYGNSIKIINELLQTSSFKVILSASVLTFDIQNLIKQQYQASDREMNIYTYIKSQSDLADIKDRMLKQANLQVKLYNGIMEETPTLHKIFENSQTITEYQRTMGKKINMLINKLPDSYIDPILLFGEYYLLLNHSMTDYVSFSKIYAKKYERYVKHFKNDELIQENFYQDSNAFLILSGQKGDAGKIVYCSKSSQYILGGEPRLYIGTNISVTSPPSLQGYFGNQFRKTTEGSTKTLFNQVTRDYVYHKDGYMVQVDSFLSIHPFLAHGFYYTLVLRPVPSHKDYMLVHENGDIECATKKISEKLGLHRSAKTSSQADKKNVSSISEELGKANEAFNKIEKCIVKKSSEEDNHEEEEEKKSAKNPEKNSGRNNFNHSSRPGNDLKKQSHVDYGLTMEQAQEIHERSQSTGPGLEFSAKGYKRLEGGKFGVPSTGLKTWYFNCTITPEVYGDLKMKLFTFQDSLQDRNEEEEVVVLDEEELNSKTNNMEIDELEYKFSEMKEAPTQMDNSAFFKSEDEKAQGWIDFHFLKSEEGLQTQLNTHPEPLYHRRERGDYRATTTYQDNNVLTTHEGGLLSPLRSPLYSPLASPLASPGNQPLIKRNETKGKTILLPVAMSKSTASANDESPNAKLNGVKTTEKPPIMAADASITGSQWSKTSQQRKISHAFKRALAVRYYPKSSLPICLGFYAVLIVVFATQVALKTTIDSTVIELSNKKEILSQAQLSNYYLVQVGGLYRLISASQSGRLTPAELGLFGFLAQILVAYGYTILQGLSVSNQNLMKSTNSLTSDSSRDFIFEPNIRVFDNYFGVGDQSYISLTNFEASNRIVEHGLMVNALQNTNITASLEGFPFLYRNALNDLLVKNEKISFLFADSLEAQREELFTIANRYLIVTIAVVVCLFIGFLYLTWRQYNEEKANLFAVVKLNTKKIQDLLGSIHAFIKIIETEKSFEKLYAEGFSISKFSKKDSKVGQKLGLSREHNKMPVYTGTTAKYMVYAGTLVGFVVLVIGLVVWNTVSDKNSASFFKTKQNQVFFADHLKSRGYLAQITSIELLNTNGLNTVENVAVADKLPLCIAEVNALRVEASTIFMNEDTSYDSDIKEVLFYDGCKPESLRISSGTYCTILEKQGFKVGLIYLLSSLEDILTTRLQKYENSDKSAAALRDIEGADYQILTSLILVTTAQAEFISSTIESGFEDELAQAKITRTTVIVIFTIGLVIFSVLMWFLFLKKLREANNKFKNVLRTLPAGLVLSSFILKSFLIKSSRGALDSVKNDI